MCCKERRNAQSREFACHLCVSRSRQSRHSWVDGRVHCDGCVFRLASRNATLGLLAVPDYDRRDHPAAGGSRRVASRRGLLGATSRWTSHRRGAYDKAPCSRMFTVMRSDQSNPFVLMTGLHPVLLVGTLAGLQWSWCVGWMACCNQVTVPFRGRFRSRFVDSRTPYHRD